MDNSPVLTGIFVKCTGVPGNSHLSPAEAQAWQVCRQEIRAAEEDRVELVEQVVASGLTLDAAWRAMSIYATALIQKGK
jgi:hypothetical protein